MLELITYEPDSGQVDSATPDLDANSAQSHTNGKEQQAGGVHCHCRLLSEDRQLQLHMTPALCALPIGKLHLPCIAHWHVRRLIARHHTHVSQATSWQHQ